MKKLLKKAALAALFFLGYINLKAQNTYALVVGLSKYQEITPLQFADRDAITFAEFLKTQSVPESNIKLYLNENATRLNVLDGLYNLTSQLKPKDRFYFYFGGHGDLEAQISSENSLLLLYNSFKKNYFQGSEFIQLFELKEWLGDLAKKQVEVVFIADACHSGGLIGGKEGISKTQTALNENWAGITKILSCKSDEFSLEGKQWGGGRGLFSYHLVNGLTGRADANKDKRISVGELDNYLKINVSKQASPNVQTPIVIGNNAQQLSVANTEGLEKLAELEQKNFALLTEVTTRGDEKRNLDDLAKLDTSIVETYKKFSKALKDKRIAPHDDSLDCALIHFKKLETYKLPDNLAQMIKRNMAVGLMQLELDLLKGAREQGFGAIARTKKVEQAINNLEEAKKLFGPNHYIYKYLEARKWVLEANRPRDLLRNKNTVDDNLRSIKENDVQMKDYLLNSLVLEPNMISTHAMLATTYRAVGKPDSSIYYQEKVIKLLPNQGAAYYSLGMSYAKMRYKDSLNLSAPHPKAVQNIEKAIALDTFYKWAYRALTNLYLGKLHLENGEMRDSAFKRFYPQAIKCQEKLASFISVSDEDIPKMVLHNYVADKFFDYLPDRWNVSDILTHYTLLSCFHKLTGNTQKAEEYLASIKKKVALSKSFFINWGVALEMYEAFDEAEDKAYLKYALEYLEGALKLAGEAVESASEKDKPYLTLHYQQLLVGVGTTHRGLKNYEESEKYLKQALEYKVLDSPATGNLKLTGGRGFGYTGDPVQYTYPNFIVKTRNGEFHYRMEANTEMVALKIDQNKPDEALYWYEKALQVSLAEHGNDTMGVPYTKFSLMSYKNIDIKKFLALREKYFPNAEKVD
jgi:tetratricopeptide (TPR) repeat protein